jgi:uncharacterized protein YjbI with pentapeptide repeats
VRAENGSQRGRRIRALIKLLARGAIPMFAFRCAVGLIIAGLLPCVAQADIYRWDNGEVIPGTEGIEPGPGVQLAGISLDYARLGDFDLSGANFAYSSLANARFLKHLGSGVGSSLAQADFTSANLSNVRFDFADLTQARFDNADIEGALFLKNSGFERQQLYTTDSYRRQRLEGTYITFQDLRGWDFSGQYLANASLVSIVGGDESYDGLDLKGADTRGTRDYRDLGGAITQNAISQYGDVWGGLDVAAGQVWSVRDYDGDFRLPGNPQPPFPILVWDGVSVNELGRIKIVIESDPWDSLISFFAGIPVQLGGTLELTFTDDVDVTSQIGRTIRIFDWTGVEPTGHFDVASRYQWDTSDLYTSGEVTLTAVPEPSTQVLLSVILPTFLLHFHPRATSFRSKSG